AGRATRAFPFPDLPLAPRGDPLGTEHHHLLAGADPAGDLDALPRRQADRDGAHVDDAVTDHPDGGAAVAAQGGPRHGEHAGPPRTATTRAHPRPPPPRPRTNAPARGPAGTAATRRSRTVTTRLL